jgi:tetratricopeptide (TPR) repeat protein
VISLGNAPISGNPLLVLAACFAFVIALGGCASDEDRLAEFMERGDAYAENDEFEEAIIEFKNVLQIDPNHAAAHEALSLAYLEVNKPREAFWEMSETVRLDPTNVDARLRYGTISSAIGEFALAREQAEAVLEIEPDHAQGYALRAQAREGLEDFEGAEADQLSAIDSRRQAAAYRFLYASFLERRQRYEEAIVVLRELVDLEPSYMAVSTLARLVAAWGNDSKEAEALFRRGIEVALETPQERVQRTEDDGDELESLLPNVIYADAVPSAYLMLASFQFSADRFHESIATLEEGTSKVEGDTRLIYQMARLYASRGMDEEADALILRATRESPDEAAPQLILSAYLGQQGDLEGALEAAVAAVAIEPDNPTAQMRHAELLVDIGYRENDTEQIENAREIVDALLAVEPSNPEANFVRAKLSLSENDPQSAEQSLLTALEARPEWAQARFVLGSALISAGEVGRARGEFARAIELDPAMADARKALTQIHAELEEHEFAVEQGRAYLRQVPGDHQVRIIVGQSLIRIGRSEEAYEEISMIPDEERGAAVYFALGRLDVAFGRKDLGRKRLLMANEMRPDNAAVLRILLALDREAGQLEQSSARIRSAVEKSPEDSDLSELMAEVAALEGDAKSARSSLERAVEIDPRNVSAQLALADLELREGDFEGTISVMESATAAIPESSDLQYRLALLYEQSGQVDKSMAAYERAIALNNNLAEAKNNLAYLLSETPGADLDRALELAQQAKEQRPDDPNAADTLGWVLLKRGVPSAAIGYLEESYERFPEDAFQFRGIVGNHLAEAYEKNREPAKAIATSEKVLAGYDRLAKAAQRRGQEVEEPDWAREARARIERLGSAG